jgi:outer membrane protein
VLTLEEALRLGRARQPALRQAQAATEAARARIDQSFSSLLPQVNGTAQYERYATSAAAAGSPAAGGGGSAIVGKTTAPADLYSFGVSGRLLLYDFGQTSGRWRAAQASASAQEQSERGTSQSVDLNVRTTYFNAVASKALVNVARDTLANEEKHLEQIRGFVEVGTRPAIDLVSERANYANSRVRLIQAENGYATARVLVEQAIGLTDLGPWDVDEVGLPPVQGEEAAPELLLNEALGARPDIASLEKQLSAQELTVSSLKGGYGPTLSLSGGASETGPSTGSLGPSWNGTLTLSWPLYQGGLTRGQVREASANASALSAQIEQLRQQVRVDVEQARLGVIAAIATLDAAKDASQAARERLTLAEGRYQTGVGNVIELSDAQLALTTALGQQVQSEFQLATARSQLMRALGRG